jgi:xanthine dehydrogenase accessory factor
MPLDRILVRGGGDLASGVALRLYRVGIRVVITELDHPLSVRAVSFSEAVYTGAHRVEGVTARLVSPQDIEASLQSGEIPVIIDPDASLLVTDSDRWSVVVDARMTKLAPAPLPAKVPLHIGLGPGFYAGRNCDAVIETRRSHTLGRVFWEGAPQADSGLPEGDPRRVLRAPIQGVVVSRARIGEHVEAGQVVAGMTNNGSGEKLVVSPLSGVLRGLVHEGIVVTKDTKIGDVDPRGDAGACFLVSDKALSIAGGVLEAIFSSQARRRSAA